MRSGYLDLSIGRLRVSGVGGYHWSSRSYSAATSAYYLAFNAADVLPSNYYYLRWFAFPLRCLKSSSLYITSLPGSGGGNRHNYLLIRYSTQPLRY